MVVAYSSGLPEAKRLALHFAAFERSHGRAATIQSQEGASRPMARPHAGNPSRTILSRQPDVDFGRKNVIHHLFLRILIGDRRGRIN